MNAEKLSSTRGSERLWKARMDIPRVMNTHGEWQRQTEISDARPSNLTPMG